MTTGSVIEDFREAVTTSCGPALAGRYFQRTWSGADQPEKSAKPAPVTYITTRHSHYTDKDGNRIEYDYDVEHVFYARQPRRAMRLDPHPYNTAWSLIDDQVFSWVFTDSPSSPRNGTATSCGFWGGTPTSNWNSGHTLSVVNQLRSKIQGSDFNAGVFLGEGSEALRMIANAATRLASGIHQFRRGRMQGAVEELTGYSHREYKDKFGVVVRDFHPSYNTLASNWLELQYGWLPLIGDLDSGARALAHFVEQPCVFTARAHRTLRGKKLPEGGVASWMSGSYVTSRQIVAYLTEVNTAKLSGLTDFESIAWELVPYSFVADWALPIGDFLSARGVASALSGTFVTSHLFKWSGTGLVSRPGLGYSFVAGSHSKSEGTFSRTVDTTLQIPMPEFKPFGEMASWKHCANAVALLTNAFK